MLLLEKYVAVFMLMGRDLMDGATLANTSAGLLGAIPLTSSVWGNRQV